MYTLYFFPDACSLATQVVLRELNQDLRLVEKSTDPEFHTLNPVGTVPVLLKDDLVLKEGAALMLHLLEEHPNHFMPTEPKAKQQTIEDILFANATMHPTYSKIFFIAQNIDDEAAKRKAFDAAAQSITALWQVVEDRLRNQPFLAGDQPGVADIMLAVYARWGDNFPVEIVMGPKTQAMLQQVHAMPNFIVSLEAEAQASA